MVAWSRVVAVEIEVGGFAISFGDRIKSRLAAGLDTGNKGNKVIKVTSKWGEW